MAILKTQAAKLKAEPAAQNPAELQLKVVKALNEATGRPEDSPKEKRTRAATAAVLSGNMTYAEAEQMYATSHKEIQRFIDRTFPTEEDRYAFLENCMLSNAYLASGVFAKKFEELTAIDAARAAAIFAGKATDIRKAREAGFKEAPINVTTIVALEKTLRNLQPQTQIDGN